MSWGVGTVVGAVIPVLCCCIRRLVPRRHAVAKVVRRPAKSSMRDEYVTVCIAIQSCTRRGGDANRRSEQTPNPRVVRSALSGPRVLPLARSDSVLLENADSVVRLEIRAELRKFGLRWVSGYGAFSQASRTPGVREGSPSNPKSCAASYPVGPS